ncbi:MAG: hypothetical protein Q7K57_38275 [Burkholderiaceae bacterium]|nr:hypothetical protein [Burkholderiaceae bacterium]
MSASSELQSIVAIRKYRPSEPDKGGGDNVFSGGAELLTAQQALVDEGDFWVVMGIIGNPQVTLRSSDAAIKSI